MDPSAWTRVGLRVAGDGLTPHLDGPPAQLYIFCLGPFRVYRNGKKITETEWGQAKGATHKIKALLAYLMASVPRGAYKDELCDLLWQNHAHPDRSDSRFYATLHYLRQALEPGLKRGEESGFIVYRDGCYQINPTLGYWVDAIAFEIHYRQAQRAEEQGKKDFAARQYKLAEALYQGDYMVGIESRYTERYDNDWCQWRRFRLKSIYLEILLKLAEYHAAMNEDRLSLHYARRALLQDNCCEQAHSLIMRVLHRAGRRSDLVQQYSLLERFLRQREDRAPSAEITRLYQELAVAR
jgi:DNA-binding SARP family transcriptional activator